jgi:glutathione S-transferase
VFFRPVKTPLSDKARADADELNRVAMQIIPHAATQLYSQWSIADADFALMLMRLIANSDAVPQKLIDYALAQWSRQSIRKFVGYIPTQDEPR